MDKFLGQDIPEQERWQFLQDNADAVEKIEERNLGRGIHHHQRCRDGKERDYGEFQRTPEAFE